MTVEEIQIAGVKMITPDVHGDARGFFMETFHTERYATEAGISDAFVQDNVSVSQKGVLRGLHFQKAPHGQGKLVSVLKGKVFDVAVDIRKNSDTFGQWVGVELSGENHKQLWIPDGLAHGYLTLEDDTIFSYKCTGVYAPEADSGVIWNDPDLAIAWPDVGMAPIVSEKDQKNGLLKDLD